MSQEIKAWKQVHSELLHRTKVFDLYVQRLRSPETNHEDDFYFIDVADWVNVIALTDANEVILIKQYRFGIHDISLEIPGGMLDDKNEDPLKAALRELTEETGYVAREVEPLGYVCPNPAIQNNRLHTFLATGAELKQAQNLDPAESISVHPTPLEQIPELIMNHSITHSLVVSAFYRFFAKKNGFGLTSDNQK